MKLGDGYMGYSLLFYLYMFDIFQENKTKTIKPLLLCDVDSHPRGPCVVSAMNKFTWTIEVLWRKGTAWPLSKWERAPTPAWKGFYCFSGYITSRMALTYYVQVHCRWLPFTDNKGKNVANYFKRKNVANLMFANQGKSGWTGYTPYLGGLAKILGSYFKDMQ